jgi:hypothetical protein
MSAPQEPHFTDRQMATRGSGAPHCEQLKGIQPITLSLESEVRLHAM